MLLRLLSSQMILPDVFILYGLESKRMTGVESSIRTELSPSSNSTPHLPIYTILPALTVR